MYNNIYYNAHLYFICTWLLTISTNKICQCMRMKYNYSVQPLYFLAVTVTN